MSIVIAIVITVYSLTCIDELRRHDSVRKAVREKYQQPPAPRLDIDALFCPRTCPVVRPESKLSTHLGSPVCIQVEESCQFARVSASAIIKMFVVAAAVAKTYGEFIRRKVFGFWSMFVFLGILTVGFIYEWRKGALEWE